MPLRCSRVVPALAGLVASGMVAGEPVESLRLDRSEVLGCRACAEAKARAGLGSVVLGASRATNETDTDVLHYDLEIEIIPATETIAGRNTVTVSSLVDGLATFELRLASGFAVPSVLVDGSAAVFARVGNTVEIDLPTPVDTGETFEVEIEYSGQAVGAGFGSIVWSTAGGQPYVYTLSETEFAYTWWPNKDVNADKATADLRFTFPEGLHLMSNGVMVSNTPISPTQRTIHYQTAYPTSTYLFCFGLGDYNTFSGSYAHPGGVMPLDFAILKIDDSPSARNAWLATQNMLAVFAGLFGEYPFVDEKYGIYQFGFGGGMEHQTMTGQGTTSSAVTAHELGHQWFGDMVTCAHWNDIWLNEGFATYTEALWYEFQNGPSDPAALRSAMLNRTPFQTSGTVYVYDTSDINRIFSYNYSYLKGGWVLHMLRGVVGDQVFFDILAQYRAAYEYGAADTLDFQAVAESVSGLSLHDFFQQWVFEGGAPYYRSSYTNLTVDGQAYAEVYLRQTQSVLQPTFKMPVDLRIGTGQGTVDVVADHTARDQHFLVALPAAATSLSVDPDLWILRTGNQSTPFVAGPPRVVGTSPSPGEVVVSALSSIEVVVHRAIQAGPGDVSLVGASTGSRAVGVSFDGPSLTLTITPDEALAADDYTLTIFDSVFDPVTARSLDGEVSGGVLPSGDGLEGGDAVIGFTYAPPAGCVGDLDGDNDTDVFDFNLFAPVFGLSLGDPGYDAIADLNGDDTVDVFDFNLFAPDFGCSE